MSFGSKTQSAWCRYQCYFLFANHFDEDAFGTLTVKFDIEETLPGTKINVPAGDREYDLVVQQEIFEVGINQIK